MSPAQETHEARERTGSWTFSLKLPSGRVVVRVSNTVLERCFGAPDGEDWLRVFASHVCLLRRAAMLRLEEGFVPCLELAQEDITVARRELH